MIRKRIDKLRELMKENGIDAYIIPSTDAHMSEYVPDYYKGREWISGFTGSAGTVVVTLSDAGLWTDGRYWIQAEKQIEDTGIKLYKTGIPNAVSITDWLKEKMDSTNVLGFDSKVFSSKYIDLLQKDLHITLKGDVDLVGDMWRDRPSISKESAFIHELKYAGFTVEEKLRQVRELMKEEKVSNYVIGSLDDICWLFNIRAYDVVNNPVLISYAIVTIDKAYLFTDLDKVKGLPLFEAGIIALPYEVIDEYVEAMDETVYYDEAKLNYFVVSKIKSSVKKVTGLNLTTTLKAQKNASEISNLKNCQIKDGVAMTKFLHWFDSSVNNNETELTVEDKLLEFRNMQPDFIQKSFDPISAYGPNAAMMHYRATNENHSVIEPKGFYLIDSGGQYIDGTTDITRTLVCGELTDEQKVDYTLVLKGHIALSKAIFLEGTTGSNLDILARRPMWEHGIDYKCGTGHGVGYLLNVHEGPQGFSRVPNKVDLKPGMIITNEPGVYKENRHGIRIENTLLVKELKETEFGKFYEFETISYCPIDMRAVLKEMLSEAELSWIEAYHTLVLEKLSPFITEELEWVKEIIKL